MTISEKIEADLLRALKEGDSFKKEALRYLKSVIKNAEIEQGGPLAQEKLIEVIRREVKRREEAIEAFQQAEKPALVKQETDELKLLEGYLPPTMTDEQIRDFVARFLQDNPELTGKTGPLMAGLARELKGKAEMKDVARVLGESQSGGDARDRLA